MPRIMIVDDSPVLRATTFETLEPFGFELAQAADGREAVDLGLASRWDLFLLDLAMPVMNGIEALTELRKSGCKTPAVLVTSSSAATRIAEAVRLGGVHYLAKPYTPEALKSVVLKLLRVDLSKLGPPPRALVQHTSPELPEAIARLLPRHIPLDSTPSLAESLDLAAARQHSLVLFESAGSLVGEETTLAQVVRATLPAAGIFAVDARSTARPWAPEDALDGRLGVPIEPDLAQTFLCPTFLRPLVFVQGTTLIAAGDDAAPAFRAAYREMLVRRLVERCGALKLVEPQVDLRNASESREEMLELVLQINEHLREMGSAPAFLVPDHLRTATSALPKVLVV